MRVGDLYELDEAPSLTDFKTMISGNGLNNNLHNMKDIEVAEGVLGPEIGALKGKTTHSQPFVAKEDIVAILQILLE